MNCLNIDTRLTIANGEVRDYTFTENLMFERSLSKGVFYTMWKKEDDDDQYYLIVPQFFLRFFYSYFPLFKHI